MVGQASNPYNQEHIKLAQQNFQLVGASASECDTIPGRQCMASCFFLLKQFDDVMVFLNSIKTYFVNDDDFNWNYGLALGVTGGGCNCMRLYVCVSACVFAHVCISHVCKSVVAMLKGRRSLQ